MEKPKLTKEQQDKLIHEFAGEKMPEFFFDGKTDINPFEVFESFFGTMNKTEKRASEITGIKNVGRLRALMNCSELGSGNRRHGFSPKTMAIINKANEIISQYNVRLTIRQVYYRLVAEQVIENSHKSYKNLDGVLVKAREAGYIPYEKFVDTSRSVLKSNSWTNPKAFFETVKKAYRKTLLDDQNNYIEVWVEKDALRSVFEPVTEAFDVTLGIGKGYTSHTALYDASKRIAEHPDKTIKILYFGDFDPSGEDIFRNLKVRTRELFGVTADFEKVSLTREDIDTYKLPPAPAKRSDTRFENFVQEHGDISVELDALPPNILEEKIRESILRNIDIEKYKTRLDQEKTEREAIEKLIQKI